MKKAKAAVLTLCRRLQRKADDVAMRIGKFAELPMREERSSALAKEVLIEHGFAIEREFPLIPNAFVAARGKGRPVIGLLAEYDALPDCGPKAKGPGHGCGHNLLGTASVYAAIAAATVAEEQKLRGTVKLFGCPAEETLVGKVYMARDGAFKGLDACLAWHPGGGTRVNNGSGTALDSYSFEFHGKTAHAAGDPQSGRSALDAVEIMNVAVNFLREHMPPSCRVHYIISDGANAPNVVPAYARSWYFVRGQRRKDVDELARRVSKCAKAAALATETRLKVRHLTACYDRLGNDTLAHAMHENLKVVGPPRFTKADRELVRKLGLEGKFSGKLEDINTERGAGSSDEGNVSWFAPLVCLSTTCAAEGTIGHSYLKAEQARSPIGLKGMRVATKVLGLTAYDLLTDGKLRAKAKREFRRRSKGTKYDPVIPKGQPAPVDDIIPRL
ncbi:MAG: amidohydrolase [Armatimonadota bacterium]|jgi:aminobenzoyl-glutamate utilization protein B